MSKREPSVLLDDIRTSIEKIQRYTAGLDEGSFLADEKTTDAVVRNLEIIGEAAKQLPVEFKNRRLGIAWAQNSRLAQPHRARLCGNRSETRQEHFANSDSEVGLSDCRVEITTIERFRDSKALVLRHSEIRDIRGCLPIQTFRASTLQLITPAQSI